MRNSQQFRFRVFEKQIVMSDKPVLFVCRLDQPLVIDFPQPQAE